MNTVDHFTIPLPQLGYIVSFVRVDTELGWHGALMSRSVEGFRQEGEELSGRVSLDLGTDEEQTQKDILEGCLSMASSASIDLVGAKYGEPNIEETQQLCSTLRNAIAARPVWS